LVHPSNPPKSPVTAALLSFLICCIPFGHFYIGQTVKGLIWIGITVFTGGLACVVAAVDAYMCAKKLERGQPIGEFEFFPS
jgi:TM2 domain-containing membrane protein YozV